MIKLSPVQQLVINKAKASIDKARKYKTYEEYFINERSKNNNASFNTPEKYKAKDIEMWNQFVEGWEETKKSIVSTNCNTKTILKLESLGLIKIVYNSNNQTLGYDKIEILNY